MDNNNPPRTEQEANNQTNQFQQISSANNKDSAKSTIIPALIIIPVLVIILSLVIIYLSKLGILHILK